MPIILSDPNLAIWMIITLGHEINTLLDNQNLE
jgi:hypothetical protein